jgi:hypothetical protein
MAYVSARSCLVVRARATTGSDHQPPPSWGWESAPALGSLGFPKRRMTTSVSDAESVDRTCKTEWSLSLVTVHVADGIVLLSVSVVMMSSAGDGGFVCGGYGCLVWYGECGFSRRVKCTEDKKVGGGMPLYLSLICSLWAQCYVWPCWPFLLDERSRRSFGALGAGRGGPLIRSQNHTLCTDGSFGVSGILVVGLSPIVSSSLVAVSVQI